MMHNKRCIYVESMLNRKMMGIYMHAKNRDNIDYMQLVSMVVYGTIMRQV